jgi:hypothetical protein
VQCDGIGKAHGRDPHLPDLVNDPGDPPELNSASVKVVNRRCPAQVGHRVERGLSQDQPRHQILSSAGQRDRYGAAHAVADELGVSDAGDFHPSDTRTIRTNYRVLHLIVHSSARTRAQLSSQASRRR